MPSRYNHRRNYNNSGSTNDTFPTIRFEFDEQLLYLLGGLKIKPGISIGHITALHDGHVILLSGFKGYKVRILSFFIWKIFNLFVLINLINQ